MHHGHIIMLQTQLIFAIIGILHTGMEATYITIVFTISEIVKLPRNQRKIEQKFFGNKYLFSLQITNTMSTGNNLGWTCLQCGIIESHVTAYKVFFSRLLYAARACNLLVSSVKTNVTLPINQWCFL